MQQFLQVLIDVCTCGRCVQTVKGSAQLQHSELLVTDDKWSGDLANLRSVVWPQRQAALHALPTLTLQSALHDRNSPGCMVFHLTAYTGMPCPLYVAR